MTAVAKRAPLLVLLTVLTVAVAVTVVATHRASRPAEVTEVTDEMPTMFESAPQLRPHVAFIGDSYVGGSAMGGSGDSNFTHKFAEQMGWYAYAVDGVGGSGYSAGVDFEAGARHFSAPERHRYLDANVSLVFVVNGFNDYKLPLAPTEQNALLAYERIKDAAPNARVVAIGYLPLRKETKTDVKRNAALARAAVRAGVMFWNPVGTGWLTGPNARWLGADRYHLTDDGHTYFADVLTTRAKAEGLDKVRTHLTRAEVASTLGS